MIKLKIIFFFVKLFNLNSCTYMWFDAKTTTINLYVGNARSGMCHLPTKYVTNKYAIFLASIGQVRRFKLSKSETIYVLESVETEEDFNNKRMSTRNDKV